MAASGLDEACAATNLKLCTAVARSAVFANLMYSHRRKKTAEKLAFFDPREGPRADDGIALSPISHPKGKHMSEEVFGKLSELHGQVRARIEASPDWKVLQAVERAMGDVKSLLPVAPVVAAVEAVAEAPAPAVTEAVAEQAAPEVPAVAAVEHAVAEPPVPAIAEAAAAEVAVEAPAPESAAAIAETVETPAAETPVPAELKELVAEITATPEAAPPANGATTH